MDVIGSMSYEIPYTTTLNVVSRLVGFSFSSSDRALIFERACKMKETNCFREEIFERVANTSTCTTRKPVVSPFPLRIRSVL